MSDREFSRIRHFKTSTSSSSARFATGLDLDDPRWRLAQRIAASRSIGRSPLLSDFLLYVCDRHLRNKASDLTEQRIGVRVFGRVEGYNSNDDNIVRNYARTLRKRVEDYFATEGRHEDLHLEIPRGGYAPVFTPRSPETPAFLIDSAISEKNAAVSDEIKYEHTAFDQVPVEAIHAEASASQVLSLVEEREATAHKDRMRWWVWLAVAAVLLAVVTVTLWRWHNGVQATQAVAAENDAFWGSLFQKDRDTFLVPADSGLVILQGFTRKPVSLNEYATGIYHADVSSLYGTQASEINDLAMRRYTSIADLNLVSHLSRLKQVIPERMVIRFARDLRIDDLRSGNAVLLGSVDSNPWDDLFTKQLNFRFSFAPESDAAPTIMNAHPRAGEQTVYANRHVGEWHNTFAVVSYVPNLDGKGHVLMIGGLNMAGTEAAGEFVLNPDLMKSTLDHARRPNGTFRSFEILIETDTVAAEASTPHVISERIGEADTATMTAR